MKIATLPLRSAPCSLSAFKRLAESLTSSRKPVERCRIVRVRRRARPSCRSAGRDHRYRRKNQKTLLQHHFGLPECTRSRLIRNLRGCAPKVSIPVDRLNAVHAARVWESLDKRPRRSLWRHLIFRITLASRAPSKRARCRSEEPLWPSDVEDRPARLHPASGQRASRCSDDKLGTLRSPRQRQAPPVLPLPQHTSVIVCRLKARLIECSKTVDADDDYNGFVT